MNGSHGAGGGSGRHGLWPLNGLNRANPIGPARPWRWYWNRLSVMEPLEWPHRAVGALKQLRSATRLSSAGVRVPPQQLRLRPPQRWMQRAPVLGDAETQALIDEADAMARGRLRRLDGTWADGGSPTLWQRTPLPLDGGGAEADALREAIERHRHGSIVRLAQAWHLQRQPRHLEALREQLQSWFEQCPGPRGVAWASALDAALRLLNWSIAWQLLGVDEAGGALLPSALRRRWIDSVYEHAVFVHKHRSRFSSANNHLLGELVGLVAAGTTWPLWGDLVRWSDAAAREVPVELFKQTHADGGSREQASWYQVFVFELMTAHVCMRRAAGAADDERLMRRLAAMARFVAALGDAGGRISHHGDADHASALPLAPHRGGDGSGAYRRLLALAGGLGVAAELQPLIGAPAPDGAWLFGPQPAATAEVGLARRRRLLRCTLPRAMADSGLYLLGAGFGGPREVLMTVDAGPLGYLGIAAHGHADALSLRLSVGGHAVLVDRGTYTYNGDAAWRHYYRSTAAHNTVCVDGADQSGYGGPFLWLRKARCQVTSFDSSDREGHIDAWHDGYGALASPLTHRRHVRWSGRQQAVDGAVDGTFDGVFHVTDTLQGQGLHSVAVAWHLAPDCVAVLQDGGAELRTPGGDTLRLTVLPTGPQGPQGGWQLHRGGATAPDAVNPHGWHSPRFGVQVSATTLLWRASVAAPCEIRTRIEIKTHRGDD